MSAFSYAYAMPDFMSQGCKDKGPHLITIVLVGWSGQYFFYDCSDFRFLPVQPSIMVCMDQGIYLEMSGSISNSPPGRKCFCALAGFTDMVTFSADCTNGIDIIRHMISSRTGICACPFQAEMSKRT